MFHPDSQEFRNLTLVIGPPLHEPDRSASAPTDHGHKAHGLDVILTPYHWRTRTSRPTCYVWERAPDPPHAVDGERGTSYPISEMTHVLQLCWPCACCVTRAMDCDGLRCLGACQNDVCAWWHDVDGCFDAGHVRPYDEVISHRG